MKQLREDTQFVNLLEYYVLNSIGELSDDKKSEVKRIESHLRNDKNASLNRRFESLSLGLEWTSAQQPDIQRIWEKYRSWAIQRGALPDPQAFATSYVDQHFGENASTLTANGSKT